MAGPALAQGYRQNYGYATPNDPMASGGGRGNYGGGFIERSERSAEAEASLKALLSNQVAA